MRPFTCGDAIHVHSWNQCYMLPMLLLFVCVVYAGMCACLHIDFFIEQKVSHMGIKGAL